MKVCSNGPGHRMKMAATPLNGKKAPQKSLEPEGHSPWDVVCSIVDVRHGGLC